MTDERKRELIADQVLRLRRRGVKVAPRVKSPRSTVFEKIQSIDTEMGLEILCKFPPKWGMPSGGFGIRYSGEGYPELWGFYGKTPRFIDYAVSSWQPQQPKEEPQPSLEKTAFEIHKGLEGYWE